MGVSLTSALEQAARRLQESGRDAVALYVSPVLRDMVADMQHARVVDSKTELPCNIDRRVNIKESLV